MSAPSTHTALDNGHPAHAWQNAFAQHAVLTALEKANRDLLRQVGRSARHHSNGLRDMEPSRWHTVIPTRDVNVDQLVEDALSVFRQSARCLNSTAAYCIEHAVATYLRVVIAAGQEHNPDTLAEHIAAANCPTLAA